MRRTDREIKNFHEIVDVLNKCSVIRLGINAPDYPYVVPMNFGVEIEAESLVLWLHCATGGLKLDLISQNPKVGFEADCPYKLIAAESACGYTMEFESVIGCGNMTVYNKNTEPENTCKLRGLKAIMRHYAPDENFDFPVARLAGVCVLRLDVAQITGKHLKK